MDQAVSGVSESQEIVSDAAENSPIIVVVMGVSGCGKSTLASRLASALDLPYIDADQLHPQSNVDKMSNGIPLTDEDRAPWLLIVRNQAEKICADQTEGFAAPSSLPPEHVSSSNGTDEGVYSENHKAAAPSKLRGVVVACSALRQQYRETLRGSKHHHDHTEDGSAHASASYSHPIPTYFVFLKGERETLFSRMSSRQNHFMKAAMLDSQLKTLESPDETGEEGIITVHVEETMDKQVELAKAGLQRYGISC